MVTLNANSDLGQALGLVSTVGARTPQAATTRALVDSLVVPSFEDRIIAPPASLFAASAATAWYTANAATFMRFTVHRTRTFRYVNLWVGAASGNIQVAVSRFRPRAGDAFQVDALRVAHSGVIACPSAGAQRVDLGFFTLTPGDYALSLWCDNTTATFLHGLATGMTGSRLMFSTTGLATGVNTVTTIGTTTRWVSGLTLEADSLPLVALGDSITANDAAGVGTSGAWLSNADDATGYRFYPITNAGVAGERTDQILTRTASAVAGARYVTVLAGTNDVGQDVDPATTIANLTAIYNAITTAGAKFMACTITPRANVASSATPLTTSRAANLRTINAWIRANYTAWAGAVLCDWAWALSDGTDESSPLAANFADYVHPNATGSAIMSPLVIKATRDWT